MNTMTEDNADMNKQELWLHASSVNVNGKALVFLGHSGSGKSTIARFLSQRYPIITDDRIRIWKNEAGHWFAGDESDKRIPNSVAWGQADRTEVLPLLAIIRIYKSDRESIQPISPRMTCCHLIDAVFEVDIQRKEHDAAIVKKWFALLADVSRKTRGWHLTFRINDSIFLLIDKFFIDYG